MKRLQAEFPFENYWLYVVLHKQQKRRMANLVKKGTNSKNRTTISYARYLMSVSLKRMLSDCEHVDHIDNNTLNDTLDNLQILTQEENNSKEMSRNHRKAHYIQVCCSGCDRLFDISSRNYKSKIKSGNKRFFCNRECYILAR